MEYVNDKKVKQDNILKNYLHFPIQVLTYFYFSSKENKYVPSEQKILIDQIGKFQSRLEGVDTFDHVIMPPLYKQVVR